MTSISAPAEEQLVACEICLKEVPVSAAQCAEAEDYVMHFCGLDCYAVWRQQQIGREGPAVDTAKPAGK